MHLFHNVTLLTVFLPLLGALIAGLSGPKLGRCRAQWVTILCMFGSTTAAVWLFYYLLHHASPPAWTLYHWGMVGRFHFDIGFMVDRLTAVMFLLVTIVSTIVHFYSIGYMKDHTGFQNQRFFAYMSLFTFMMLMLVSAHNFLQLFFGWEGVGLVSYLLIGFYYQKDSAAFGSLKAFLVNRVGDFGFILAIAALLDYVGSLDYTTIFAHAAALQSQTVTLFPHVSSSVLTLCCLLLFIGAMGKSAQIPLHVWLPESMEGPTPISALIHAATMVTAGVFLVARMSPLFEYSPAARSVVLIVGATGALFTGLLAFVENDIKRVIAFSTMSQLGYMMAADGASVYKAAIFHLLTHGFFKALLFLAAGSIIIALHHEQDLRKMGGLRKSLPWTHITFLIGALSLAAIPPFSGFYSKEVIIEAIARSQLPGASYAYWCLLTGAFVTSFYIFRAYFMAFWGRLRKDTANTVQEPSHFMRVALVLLSVPALLLGAATVDWILFAKSSLLEGAFPQSAHSALVAIGSQFHGAFTMALHGIHTLPFWFAFAGIIWAWLVCILKPRRFSALRHAFEPVDRILTAQYGFDRFNHWVFVRGVHAMSRFFYQVTDQIWIDRYIVNGTGLATAKFSQWLRRLQTGYLYHYALIMVLGLVGLLCWTFLR